MANPPITIGPFNNVPAPGSPIKSDWAQAITTYVVGKAAPLHAVVFRTTELTLASGVLTSIPFNGERYDAADMHTGGAPDRLTVPAGAGGLWLVGYSLAWKPIAGAGGQRFACIGVNGIATRYASAAAPGQVAATVAQGGSVILRLAAADYVVVAASQDSGNPAVAVYGDDIGVGYSQLWATRLGD